MFITGDGRRRSIAIAEVFDVRLQQVHSGCHLLGISQPAVSCAAIDRLRDLVVAGCVDPPAAARVIDDLDVNQMMMAMMTRQTTSVRTRSLSD